MGEFEAAADLVTGGLIGRALEPGAGEGGGHGVICLNCDTALVGSHCHNCGQNGHVHRSLGGIGHELLHGVFHFEGKLWRTLPLLAWRPGELTRRYIHGERARFVSPIALFLFSIFAMFAVFSWAGITAPTDIETGGGSRAAIERARAQVTKDREDAIEDRNDSAAGSARRAEAERRIADADRLLKVIPAHPEGGTTNVNFTRMTGWAVFDHGIEKWQKNPSLMLYKLQSSIYKFSWLLIPLSLPFLWLLFAWRREYHLYDHAIFVTYSIAFMSLLFIAITIVAKLGMPGGWVAAASLILPPVHLFRQLKQAYALGWFSALVRTAILLWFCTIVASIFVTLLLVMGMF